MTYTPTSTTETLTDIELGRVESLKTLATSLDMTAELHYLDAMKCRVLKNDAGEKAAYEQVDLTRKFEDAVRWAINKLEQA